MLRALARIPLPLLYVLLRFVSALTRLIGWRRALVELHIERCLPALESRRRQLLAGRFYAYLGELTAEVLHTAHMPAEEIERCVVLENPELLDDALREGRRVMVLAAHHCNWEWLLLRCGQAFEFPLVAAYKPHGDPKVNDFLLRMRSRLGATLVPSKQLVRHLVDRRGEVRILALVADQWPAGVAEQVWLPFFGQQTAFLAGPGWISAKLGYDAYFAAMRRTARGRYVVRFEPLQRLPGHPAAEGLVAAYAKTLEAHVREQPAEYFWAYRRWKRERGLYE